MWHRGQNWYAELLWNQYPTLLSLLTDEYKTRMVQEAYHDAHDNAPQWPAQYCWPEGFMRRWHYHAVTNQPHVRITFHAEGIANRFTCQLDGNAPIACTSPFEADVTDGDHAFQVAPRWYGDTWVSGRRRLIT